MQQAASDWAELSRLVLGLPVETLAPNPEDHRFSDPSWQHGPSAIAVQAFLRTERLWDLATTDVRGLSKEHSRIVNFTMRQMLDMMAPSNFPALNPEVLTKTQATAGDNLRHGHAATSSRTCKPRAAAQHSPCRCSRARMSPSPPAASCTATS